MKYKRTAAHKRWHDWVLSQGCINHPDRPATLDHIFGASTKSGGEWIGQEAVNPLCYQCHLDPQTPWSKKANKALFQDMWGDERELHARVVQTYVDENGVFPYPENKYRLIMDYSKFKRVK